MSGDDDRLFVHFYLDENVEVVVADLLKHAGVACTTARDAGMLHRSDPDQLAHAAALGWVLVTYNRDDYLALDADYRADGRMHAGIVAAFKQPIRRLADGLIALADDKTADEMVGQVFYL